MQFTRTQIEAAYFTSPLRNLTWGIARNGHEALPRGQAERLIQSVYPLPVTYDFGRRNCDEFAEMLRYQVWIRHGWRGIGLVCDYDGYHWYNCALLHENDKPVFDILEPQTGKWVKPGEATMPGSNECYDLKRGWVML